MAGLLVVAEQLSDSSPPKAPASYSPSFRTSNAFSRRFSDADFPPPDR